MLELLLLAVAANAADIVVFGDSWGTAGAKSFLAMATAHNLTVDNHAVAGSFVMQWAKRPGSLKEAVDKNQDCRWVWLTIGGNDAQFLMKNKLPMELMFSKGIIGTQEFLDPLFEAHPDVRVVQFGYDIMAWDKCKEKAKGLFWSCPDSSSAEGTACVNEQTSITQKYVEILSQQYDNHDAIDLRGSLQKAGGIDDADVGEPNESFYSPADLFGDGDDCIHPNDKGFAHIFSNMWDIYFNEQVHATSTASL